MARPRSTYYERLAPVFGMIQKLDGSEESIKIDMEEYLAHELSVSQSVANVTIPDILSLMRRRLITSLILLMLAVPAVFASLYSRSSLYDPMASVSYYGTFSDVFSNPASLPLLETDTGALALSFTFSDDWDFRDMKGERMPFLQDQAWETSASFIARNVALTASFGTEFVRQERDPVYNIYSSLRIQLDVAYAFPHISFGARIAGGNRMVRSEETIGNVMGMVTNAWFSPFKRDAGSESFDLGIGALFSYGIFSAGVYIEELMTLSDEGEIYMGWDAIGRSTTLSVALTASRFLPSDDLRFLRPRASFSITGLSGSSVIEGEVELRLQFLPDADLSIALSYLEMEHSFFRFRPENGFVSFFVRGGYAGFSGKLGLMFKADDAAVITPVIGFSYVS